MKKIISITLCFLLILGFPLSSFADNEEVIDIQGAVVKDGRTLVPVRGVFEHLGYDVNWEQSTKTATLSNSKNSIFVAVESPVFIMNGQAYNLDVPAQIIDNRTMLPLRAVGEAIGADINWDGNAQIATISTSEITIRIHASVEDKISEQQSNQPTVTTDTNSNSYAPLSFISSSYDDSYGLKMLTLNVENSLGKDISGFTIRVACFNVYREPVTGLLNPYSDFTWSDTIKANGKEKITCSLAYHSTVKFVNIAVIKYVTSDGNIVEISANNRVWKSYSLPS